MFQSPSTFLCHRFKFVVASSKVQCISITNLKNITLELTKRFELFVTRKNQSHFKASLQSWDKKKVW